MKRSRFILIIVAIVFIACLLISCTPSEKENIVGTYKLTEWTVDYEEDVPTDMIAENEAEAYLVITGSERGYYVYTDRETPLYCRQIRIKYEYSSSDENKVSSLELDDGMGWTATLYVDYPSSSRKECELRFNRIKLLNQKASTTRYARISNAVDLSAVSELVGALSYVPYEVAPLDGWFELLCDAYGLTDGFEDSEANRYLYYFINIDTEALTARLYYCENGELERHVETVGVSFVRPENSEGEGTLTVGGDTFITQEHGGNCSISRTQTFEGEEEYTVYYWLSPFVVSDIDELCAERTASLS